MALDLTADLTGFVLRALSVHNQPRAHVNINRNLTAPSFHTFRRSVDFEPALSIFTHLTLFIFVPSNPFHIPFALRPLRLS